MSGRLRIAALFPHVLDLTAAGAARRAGALCSRLAAEFEVRAVTLVEPGAGDGEATNPWGVREVRVAATTGYAAVRQDTIRRSGAPADVLALQQAGWLNPRLRAALRTFTADADIVLTIPWLASTMRAVSAAPLALMADRVEYLVRREGYPPAEIAPEAPHHIATVEREACVQARWIVVPTVRDAALLQSLYDLPADRFAVVPLVHEPFPDSVRPVFGEERRALRAGSSLAGRPLVVVGAADDGSDVGLVRNAAAVAKALPEVTTLVLGGAQARGAGIALPETMKFAGAVDEPTRDLILACADIALVPRAIATGIDLHVPDYLRRGLPVVATRAGLLGIDAPDAAIGTSPSDMARCTTILLRDPAGAQAIARAGAAAYSALGDGGAGVRELCSRLIGDMVVA